VEDLLFRQLPVFLGVLITAVMLGIAGFMLGLIGDNADFVSRQMHASNMQRQYANLSRFQGTEIAYTEVLMAVYQHSSMDLPIAVVPAPMWNSHSTNGIVNDGSVFGFPFDAHTFSTQIVGTPLLSPQDFNPVSGTGLWTGPRPTPGLDSNFRQIAEFLQDISRPNSLLSFSGRVLRSPNGYPYLVVFTFTP